MMLTGGKVSLSAYIDNVLAQHFEQYRKKSKRHTPERWKNSSKAERRKEHDIETDILRTAAVLSLRAVEILPHRHGWTVGKNGCRRKDGRTGRRRKSRANRTRLSGKAPTGKDKPTSRKTSGDTLKIKRIKRIISLPGTPEGNPEKAAVTATEQAEESAADEDADYSDIEVEPEEDEPEEEGYVPTPEELEEEEELGHTIPTATPTLPPGTLSRT